MIRVVKLTSARTPWREDVVMVVSPGDPNPQCATVTFCNHSFSNESGAGSELLRLVVSKDEAAEMIEALTFS